MATHDFFKICNFKMILKNQKVIELMAQEVNLPGFTLGMIELPFNGVKDKKPGETVEWNNLTVTVIVDEDLSVFKEIQNHFQKMRNYRDNEYNPFRDLFDANLILTTNKNNFNHTIVFYDCWIQSVGDIQLQSTSSEDEQVTTTLDIVYNWYEFK